MGLVFRLVSCSGERNINVFTCDPLVKIIFNLREIVKYLIAISKFKTYQSQYKSQRNHRKGVILGELRMYY